MEVKLSNDLLRRASDYARTDEELARFLKGEGLSKGFSVIAFSMVKRVTPADAKLAIHRSKAWQDTRAFDEVVDSLVGRLRPQS